MDVEVRQPRSDKDALYEVAYDEAVRALAEQQAAVGSVRGHAGYLLSAAMITTSVLGTQSLARSSNPLTWAALAGFVGVTVLSLAILRPTRLELSVTPDDLIWNYIEGAEPASLRRLHRDLSVHMQHVYFQNLRHLRIG